MMDGAPPPYSFEWWKAAMAMLAGLVGGITSGVIAWFSLSHRMTDIEKAQSTTAEALSELVESYRSDRLADIAERRAETKALAEATAAHRAEQARLLEISRHEPRPYCLVQQAALRNEFAAIATSAIKDGLNNLLLQNHERFSEVKMDIALIKQNQESFKARQQEHYVKMDTVYAQLMECESCDRRLTDDIEYTEPPQRRRKSDRG